MSSWPQRGEEFLLAAGYDRGPWLAVAFASGIALWFALDTPWQWVAAMAALLLATIAALAWWRGREERQALLLAVVTLALAASAGLALVWARSEVSGAPALAQPRLMTIDGRVLAREEQPAEGRVRIVLAARDAEDGRAVRLRVNVPLEKDLPGLREGVRVELRARLMPPAPPLLPGSYDFARAAWFEGLAATGSLAGPIRIVEPPPGGGKPLARAQRALSAHVRANLDGAPGAIAAAFASGDRGAIPPAVEDAMRDSGLTHLLSISGLHVSAVMIAAWVLATRLLGLWPALVLRVRLPLLAGAIAALAGIGYTLLTGAEVPTVRSCLAALLVVTALALGREPLSMRMVAVVAVIVLALWPEALVGPSFQMSFAAIVAIVALHDSAPVRSFLAPRDEGWLARAGRRAFMLLVTGLVIEAALTPIVLFHFHRAGLYGAFANVLAIPLVTFVAMPLIAAALLADLAGLGAPLWWLAGLALEALLALAEWTAERPGAVTLVPQMEAWIFALFVGGGGWLALWHGRVRAWGLVPVGVAVLAMTGARAPDILIARDGREVGIAAPDGRLLMLRADAESYAGENLTELAAQAQPPLALAAWPGARCSADFCSLVLQPGEQRWTLLIARSRHRTDERDLAAACERADIVVASRWLPRSCRPRWLKADRALLERSGGLAIDLQAQRIDRVADGQGLHGWWRPPPDATSRRPPPSEALRPAEPRP